jgi:tetratricopeptide (TPR) repeat protein
MHQGTQITNRYRIISKLGQGGMGAVWRVYDRLEKSEVALKQVLIPDKQLDFASKAGTDDTDKLRLSLAQEFSTLATLRHPHILSVLDFGFDDKGHPFYTMDLLEGGTDCKTYGINLARRQRIVLMGQMLQALHYLHRRGILHRDLKPDNVFVTRDEQVKVMDFGLAKRDKTQTTQSDTIRGTIAYMAPEQFQGESASVASDLFAIGVMVYEIMVGQHPFEAKTIGERIMKIMTHTPDFSAIPDDFVPWLETILAKDPSKRFPTAYDAMIAFYDAVGVERPAEDQTIRESFLQASEFVGRDAELKQLTAALENLDTQNTFFLIGGESGVGKSRLLGEFRVRALVNGANVLRGQGVEGGGLPFQLWRNIVRRMLLVVEVTDLQARILKDIVPDVSDLLGRDLPAAPEITGKAYQDRMVLNIVDLFRNLPQPVVLLLEDVQWTVESLEVLQQMLKISEQLPRLMIVVSYRDDEAADLPEKLTSMTHIKLERLDADAVSELSSAMLGDAGTNAEVVKLLYSQSEGNLFFLVETVRALAEASGDLQRIGRGELPRGVFTGGMQAITRRRLAKVDAEYAQIQTLAAIIGRELDLKLLNHRFNPDKVQAWLTAAINAAVLDVQDNTWRFAHDKLRKAIIANIPDETLPQIHRTAAETIKAVYPDDAGYNEPLLSHWQHVGDLDKIYQYLLPVVEHMISIQGAYTIAEAHLHQMLQRLPQSNGRRVALWNWLASSAEKQGNYETSRSYAEQARDLATMLDDQQGIVASLLTLADLENAQGNNIRATELLQQSLARSQQLGDQQAIARSLNTLGAVADEQGEYARATDLYQQSLALSQQLGDQQAIANSLNHLGIIAQQKGEYARATDLYQQSLALSQQLGDQRGIARSLNNLGFVAHEQGEYARTIDLYQQSLARFQQLGDQSSIAFVLLNLGLIAKAQGDYVRATDLYQQSLKLSQQLGFQLGIALVLINLGFIARAQGDYVRATDLYQQSLKLSQQLGFQLARCHNYLGLGWVAFMQGGGQASSWFGEALRIASSIQITAETLWAIVGLAGVLLRAGQADRAAQYAGLAQYHPAQNSDVSQGLSVLMPLLQAALSPDELQTALEQGKALDLDTVVQELLVEFGDDKRDVSRRNQSDT